MSDVIEPAKTSRSRCRHCRKDIEEGDWRFGSDYEGLYGDGAAAYGWFHLKCASQRMPDRLLAVLKKVKARDKGEIDDYDKLVVSCGTGVKKSASIYPYGERAPSGRAKCVKCDQVIPKDAFRVAIEREIVTGAFTTVGAGYLHPKCAAVHLENPDLGTLLQSNSKLLSKTDLDLLVKECGPARTAAKAAASGRVAQKPAKPAKGGAELVYADSLIEKNDPRGELIVVESELHAMGVDDKRAVKLEKRVDELHPKATKLWTKELKAKDVKQFKLEGGLPSQVQVKLGTRKLGKVPNHPWIVGYRATDGAEAMLAALLKHPTFTRIRHLMIERMDFTWDGLRGFASCDEVKALESLHIAPNLGPRMLLMLLGSTRFERLTHLGLGSMFALDPDLRGFEGVGGLPALRSLHTQMGAAGGIMDRLLTSPLVQRLEELGILAYGFAESIAKLKLKLPNLRRLVILGGMYSKRQAEIIASLDLPELKSLSIANTNASREVALAFSKQNGAIPSLERLDVSGNALSDDTLDQLRKRFGDRLIAKNMLPPPKKTPSTPRRRRAD